MFGSRIKIDDDLLQRARACASREGYASVDEFVVHAVEKEVARLTQEDQASDEQEIRRRLKGLGYIE